MEDAAAQHEAVNTFVSITGASEAVAIRSLQENGGDLNAAVNSYFNTRDTSLPALQREEPERVDFMEEDEPPPPVQSRGGLGLPAGRLGLPSWSLPTLDPLRNLLGGPGERTARPYVTEPREVRQVPIDWRDAEPRGAGLDIQDVSHDDTLPRGVTSNIVNMEDDPPASFPAGYPRHSSPERHPFAPDVAEIPSVPTADYDVEEEMLQAAIEASKRETQQEPTATGSGQGVASEEDEIARAVSLSIQTAEEEKRLREVLSGEMSDALFPKDSRRPSSSSAASRVVIVDDVEDDVQPLLRRGSARQTDQVDTDAARLQRLSLPPENEEHNPPNASRPGEWAGISSEEQDEAVMLEAAMFGGIPQIPHYHFPAPGSPRAPQPVSPSVVAQRLLREQQDDEYLASLAADQEKEMKAKQEAEVANQRERQRIEEQQRQSRAAEELERKLAAIADSLPPEPAQDDDNAVTILVRLPDGSRHGRRFLKSDKLQNLFDFMDVQRVVKPGTYRLVRQYPRCAFTAEEHSSSFDSLGLTSKQEALFLESI